MAFSKNFITIILLISVFTNFAQIQSSKKHAYQFLSDFERKSGDPLIVINGEPINCTMDLIKPENIAGMTVLKSNDGFTKYGQAGINGVILVETKNISRKMLKKMRMIYSLNYENNHSLKRMILKGNITDCDNMSLANVQIFNLNTAEKANSSANGSFEIKVRKNDVLEVSQIGYLSHRFLFENKHDVLIKLKAKPIIATQNQNIMVKKPIIYLYPETKTEVSLKLNFAGKLQTTFPKYENSWEIVAYPDGKIYDKKTKRFYNSLFWDGEKEFDNEHYNYKTGFVVAKNDLNTFLIEKLESIGLNNAETNDFVQFWLPILEKNDHNFIHFLVNEKYDVISLNEMSPKSDTSIRVFMEFYKTSATQIVTPQKFSKTERKGFVLVEWGGSDVLKKITTDLN